MDAECISEEEYRRVAERLDAFAGETPKGPVRAICGLCGEEIPSAVPRGSRLSFTWDHIIPKSLGGGNERSNLQPAHWICNNRKGSKLP